MVLVVMYSVCVVGHRHARSSSFGPKGKTRRKGKRVFLFFRRDRSRRIYAPRGNLNDEKTRTRERESEMTCEEKRVSERRFAKYRARENKKRKRVSCSVSRRHQALVGFTTPPTNYHRRMVN
jgi:hypothetical protein